MVGHQEAGSPCRGCIHVETTVRASDDGGRNPHSQIFNSPSLALKITINRDHRGSSAVLFSRWVGIDVSCLGVATSLVVRLPCASEAQQT